MFLPQQTIQYRTYLIETMVQSLAPVFANHNDPLLQRTRVSIGYPRTLAEFPAVVCRFHEGVIHNAGVGHQETLLIQEESAGSEISITLPETAGVVLNWDPVPGAVGYNVYRGTSSGGEDQSFSVSAPSFFDQGLQGVAIAPPGNPESDLAIPNPTASIQAGGALAPGQYFYYVTAVSPGQAAKYKHYYYKGDIEFAIFALSAYDRDLVADTLVQTIAMGTLESYTQNFLNRIYPSDAQYPYAQFHFIAVNTDSLRGTGDSQQATPWGAEDDLLYTNSYMTNVFGELYSLPPKTTWGLIQKVFVYAQAQGFANSPAPYVASS